MIQKGCLKHTNIFIAFISHVQSVQSVCNMFAHLTYHLSKSGRKKSNIQIFQYVRLQKESAINASKHPLNNRKKYEAKPVLLNGYDSSKTNRTSMTNDLFPTWGMSVEISY